MTKKSKILIVDDDEGIRNQLKWALDDIYIVETAPDVKSTKQKLADFQPDLITLDIALSPFAGDSDGIDLLGDVVKIDPTIKVIMITGTDDKNKALEAVSLGAYDFYQKPIIISEIKIIISRALGMQYLERENRRLASQVIQASSYQDIIGNHPSVQDIFRTIDSVAPIDITVLITGESGTGKELVARAIHAKSPRAGKPFVAINCGAIPESLLESEMFGHEKGSFTGAYQRKIGRLETANHGTVFLDEIGELPNELQVKILRFLQDHSIERIGAESPIELDVRVVAATNKNLKEAMKEKTFRDDLYYRLSVINISLPSLSERGDDKLLLAKYFLDKYCRQYSKNGLAFSDDAIESINGYRWPGNIRELENRIKRGVIITKSSTISSEDINIDSSELSMKTPMTLFDFRDIYEKKFIKEKIESSRWNISKVARQLDISRTTLYDLLEKYGIAKNKTR
ncbi:MAG: PEP-CTERM-box response regulator transcription factor [candidate division Zixibacteria bacterium]|nr:PEP-CTERM-box response regulator transcription factor [candidate division Zixibacteria bacterium]